MHSVYAFYLQTKELLVDLLIITKQLLCTHKKQKKKFWKEFVIPSARQNDISYLQEDRGMGMVRHWNNSLHREVVKLPSLEVFKMRLLGDMVSGEQLDLIILKVFYNFNDSVIRKGRWRYIEIRMACSMSPFPNGIPQAVLIFRKFL